MAQAPGANAKKKELAKADEFTQELLRWTYDRLKPFYTRNFNVTGKGDKAMSTTSETLWSLLEKSSSRELTGKEQLSQLTAYAEELSPEDAEIFCKVLNKDLRIGLKETSINQVFPSLVPVFKFMKAKPYDPKRLQPGSYMSLKLDGIRGLVRDGQMYSSGGRVIQGVDHILKQIGSDLELDGELLIPGLSFQESSGRIRSSRETPEAVYQVFDYSNSEGLGFRRRYSTLVTASWCWGPNVKLLDHIRADIDEYIQGEFAKALDKGFEGLVIKAPNAPYEPKRSFNWMKLKAEDPEEVTIIGFEEGKGKFEGTLGSVIALRENGVEVSVGAFPDTVRHHIWNNKELWKGEIIEIKFHEETPDGSLRHPRYDHSQDVRIHRHRWDKSGNPLSVW